MILFNYFRSPHNRTLDPRNTKITSIAIIGSLLAMWLGLNSSAFAGYSSDYGCLHLQIDLKNNTKNTCYLLMEDFDYTFNQISENHDFAFKILPDEVSPMIDIRPKNAIDSAYQPTVVEFVYECGPNTYIRLHSEKNFCGKDNSVNAYVVSAANLNAFAKTSVANYWYGKSAQIHWTLESTNGHLRRKDLGRTPSNY